MKETVTYKLKYVGKAPWKVIEFNGVRYYFSKKRPVKQVPDAVYKYLSSSRTGHEDDFVVVESSLAVPKVVEQPVEKPEEPKKEAPKVSTPVKKAPKKTVKKG